MKSLKTYILEKLVINKKFSFYNELDEMLDYLKSNKDNFERSYISTGWGFNLNLEKIKNISIDYIWNIIINIGDIVNETEAKDAFLRGKIIARLVKNHNDSDYVSIEFPIDTEPMYDRWHQNTNFVTGDIKFEYSYNEPKNIQVFLAVSPYSICNSYKDVDTCIIDKNDVIKLIKFITRNNKCTHRDFWRKKTLNDILNSNILK